MSEKYKFNNLEGTYFVTMTIVHWIDLSTRKELKHVIVESLQYCQNKKDLNMHAWCLMPSHRVRTSRSNPQGISKYKVWQDGNQPKEIMSNEFLDQKLNYIHFNPVEVEIVDESEHDRYSSARDYSGAKGLLEIVRLDRKARVANARQLGVVIEIIRQSRSKPRED